MTDLHREALNATWNAAIEAPVGGAADVDLRLRAVEIAIRFAGPAADLATVLRAAAFVTKFALDGVAPPLLAAADEDEVS